MKNFVAKSSAQLLFFAMGFVTLFSMYPAGVVLMLVFFLTGNNISNFLLVESLENIHYVLIYATALLAVGFTVIAGGAIYTLLQIFLNRMFYGKVLPSCKKRYIKATFSLNTVLVLSFFGIGYSDFIGASRSWLGFVLIFIPVFLFFAVWWAQHLLNQYACGIKVVTEIPEQ